MTAFELNPFIEQMLSEYNSDSWDGREVTDERRIEIERMLLDAQEMKDVKIASLLQWIDAVEEEQASFTGKVEYHSAKIAEWKKKSEACESQIERNRRMIQMLLGDEVRTGKNRIDGRSLFYIRSKYVSVSDVKALPEECVRRTDPEPRKDEIKKRLKAGQDVPGAMLLDSEPTLVIR